MKERHISDLDEAVNLLPAGGGCCGDTHRVKFNMDKVHFLQQNQQIYCCSS